MEEIGDHCMLFGSTRRGRQGQRCQGQEKVSGHHGQRNEQLLNLIFPSFSLISVTEILTFATKGRNLQGPKIEICRQTII